MQHFTMSDLGLHFLLMSFFWDARLSIKFITLVQKVNNSIKIYKELLTFCAKVTKLLKYFFLIFARNADLTFHTNSPKEAIKLTTPCKNVSSGIC